MYSTFGRSTLCKLGVESFQDQNKDHGAKAEDEPGESRKGAGAVRRKLFTTENCCLSWVMSKKRQ